MEQIKKQYNTGGMKLELIKQQKKNDREIIAIYSTHSSESGCSAGYEVHRVRLRKTGFKPEPHWINPSTEQFGSYGWACPNIKRAETMFDSLLGSNRERH